MENRDFLIEAAAFFLCEGDKDDLTITQQFDLLEKVCKNEQQIHPPEQVIVWKPFEYWMGNDILEEIYKLAGLLERLYNLGKEYGAKTGG